jgi:DNA-binding NtrC family response regulator
VNVIVTTGGSDGAAAAALVLIQVEHAQIVTTSAGQIARTLQGLAESSTVPTAVHICGVGVHEDEDTEPLFAALDQLKAAGTEVIWYCGRGYLEYVRDRITQSATTAFYDCASNAEAVARFFDLERRGRVPLLLDVAREYVAREFSDDRELRFWHGLIDASRIRYFRYGDREAGPRAIRKLAGRVEVTAADRGEVERFKDSEGRPLPIGSSPVMKRLREIVERVAPIDEPALILGPSGAGKELVARSLHDGSARSSGPFVPVNCAIFGTNADLAHDRLFGHAEGAYTGAKGSATGAFEEANGGTLFLDELGELPLEVQTQLLRVLEEGVVRPLGTMKTRPVDVRIVAATNRDLPAMIEEGTFRLDLYHRLNVLTLRVPALRERLEDTKAIARDVINRLGENGHKLSLKRQDWTAIQEYDWPGNIRQFINVLKRAAYMGIPVAEILADEARLPQGGGGGGAELLRLFQPRSIHDVRPEAEIRAAYMRHVFELFDHNWSRTAKALEVVPNTLRKWISQGGS